MPLYASPFPAVSFSSTGQPCKAGRAVTSSGVSRPAIRLLSSSPCDARTSRTRRVDRDDHALRRLDHFTGVEAEILAIAHRHDLHAGAKLPVTADRYGEAREAKQRRQQRRPHQLQDLLLATRLDVGHLL